MILLSQLGLLNIKTSLADFSTDKLTFSASKSTLTTRQQTANALLYSFYTMKLTVLNNKQIDPARNRLISTDLPTGERDDFRDCGQVHAVATSDKQHP